MFFTPNYSTEIRADNNIKKSDTDLLETAQSEIVQVYSGPVLFRPFVIVSVIRHPNILGWRMTEFSHDIVSVIRHL